MRWLVLREAVCRWLRTNSPSLRGGRMLPMMPEPEPEPGPKPKAPISPARLAANRANSLKSTGPRTPEGKEVSRLNGLTHGMRSELPILPGEDPDALRRRIAVWTGELGAETESERHLVEAAVQASWRLDRCRGVETAALTRHVLKAEEGFDDGLAQEVDGLVERLAEDPAGVVRQLRRSSLGCRWLLEQWEALADRLKAWKGVHPTERRQAILIMGKRTNEAFTDPFVARWNAAYLGALLGDARTDTDRVDSRKVLSRSRLSLC